MFDVDRQTAVRELLLNRARADGRVTGAAVTGSAARGAADRWSDVDLFLGVEDTVEVAEVLADWTVFVEEGLGAVHHFDLTGGGATYRAFLLDDGLEVDVGFTRAAGFGPHGDGPFLVRFGSPTAPQVEYRPDPAHVIGLAWHHVLHVRTSIERGLVWQAEHWLSALRDLVIELGCLRLGLPAFYAKGADRLPAADLARLEPTLPAAVDPTELSRALGATVNALLPEMVAVDPAAAERLIPVLTALTGSAVTSTEGLRPAAPGTVTA